LGEDTEEAVGRRQSLGEESAMNADSYENWIRVLPLPTDAQWTAFAEHVCRAHSWYKHLPLLTGAEFVFFLAPDAGSGFSDDGPRMHYSWTNTSEYRRRFGYLDYIWRTEANASFDRDAHHECDGMPIVGASLHRTASATNLPAELLDNASAILYPYVSSDLHPDEWPDYPDYDHELMEIVQGRKHPDRDQLTEWKKLHVEFRGLRLSDENRDILDRVFDSGLSADEYAAVHGALPPDVHRYFVLEEEMNRVCSFLHRKERQKVDRALAWLAEWLAATRLAK
jgi:hypothetical protein